MILRTEIVEHLGENQRMKDFIVIGTFPYFLIIGTSSMNIFFNNL